MYTHPDHKLTSILQISILILNKSEELSHLQHIIRRFLFNYELIVNTSCESKTKNGEKPSSVSNFINLFPNVLSSDIIELEKLQGN